LYLNEYLDIYDVSEELYVMYVYMLEIPSHSQQLSLKVGKIILHLARNSKVI